MTRKKKIEAQNLLVVHSLLDHSVQPTVVKRNPVPQQHTTSMCRTNNLSGRSGYHELTLGQLCLQLSPEQISQLCFIMIVGESAASTSLSQ